jgi:hypothetical protein
MRRLFWLAMGAGITGVAVRKANKVAQSFTPAGVSDRLGGVTELVRDFADEVKAGMVERELELRHSLGLDEELDDPAAGPTGTERKGVY